MLQKINSAIFTSLLDTHVLPTLSTFHSLISKEIPRRRGTVDCASVPFSVRFQRRLFQGGNRNKKRRDRFTGYWCCWWNTLAFFLQLKQVLVPRGALAPQARAHLPDLGTGSARRLRLEPHWALTPCELTGALPPGLCHQGIGHALCKQSGKEWWAHLLSTT